MTLEDEIRLLKDKIALLERVKELQDLMEKAIPLKEYVPYPVYPSTTPWPWHPSFTWKVGTIYPIYTASGTI